MVRTENVSVDFCVGDLTPKIVGDHKVVYAPPRVVLARVEPVGPPGIDSRGVRVEIPKCVGEPGLQQLCELGTLLVGEPSVLMVGLRIFQVDLLMGDILIATQHHRFLLCERGDIRPEGVLPLHAKR